MAEGARVDARQFTNIGDGGPVNEGQQIAFTLEFAEGPASFYCDHVLLPLLLATLTSYGEWAEQLRDQVRAGEFVTACPFQVSEVTNSGCSSDGKLVTAEFATTRGFPIQIAMSPEQAAQTIEFLKREIEKASGREPGSKPH